MIRITGLWAFLRITVMAVVIMTIAGCGGEDKTTIAPRTSTRIQTAATSTATTKTAEAAGIQLPAGLQSATGTPMPEEMPDLISLQGKVLYPVIVPTYLPSGYTLETDLIGQGGKTAKDPVGYYSFRFADSGNANRSLAFNQSRANSKELSGYYLTEEEINGVNYQIYWHQTRDYLPECGSVRTYAVGDAETFFVVWKSPYTDPFTAPQ